MSEAPLPPQDTAEDINRRLRELSDRMREANRQLREQRGETPYSPEEIN